MAGAYCRYCDRRCFVYRIVPDGPRKGWAGHMATCLYLAEVDAERIGGPPGQRCRIEWCDSEGNVLTTAETESTATADYAARWAAEQARAAHMLRALNHETTVTAD